MLTGILTKKVAPSLTDGTIWERVQCWICRSVSLQTALSSLGHFGGNYTYFITVNIIKEYYVKTSALCKLFFLHLKALIYIKN